MGKKKFDNLSFRSKHLIILFSLLTVIFSLMVCSIYTIKHYYNQNIVVKDINAKHEQLDKSLDALIDDANAASISIFDEDNFYSVINSDDKNASFNKLYSVQPLSPNIFHGISFYQNEKEICFATSEDIQSLPYMSPSMYQKVITSTSSPLVYCLSTFNENGEYLILGKKIQISGQDPGVAFIYLNEDTIYSLVKNILSTDKNYLIDSQKNIVSSSNIEELGGVILNPDNLGLLDDNANKTLTYEGEKSLVSVNTLSSVEDSFKFSWQIVSIQDYDSIYYWINVTEILLFSIAGLFFLIAVISVILISKSVAKPIKELAVTVDDYDLFNSSNNKTESYKPSHNEISHLEDSYHQMIQRIDFLMQQNIKDMDEKRILELESLQMQINPHFLYNTLDAIAWMAKINNQPEIENLVISLAKFFRLSLHSGEKIITVKDELELTTHFIDIQLVRFPDRFSVVYQVDESLNNCLTLKLLMQPIVENSIKYAFQSKKGTLTIKVSKEDENTIVYEIKDDGEGFEVKDDILSKKENKAPNRSGYGLFNVQERIKLEYGAKYGISIKSSVGHGTDVKIRIPLLRKEVS